MVGQGQAGGDGLLVASDAKATTTPSRYTVALPTPVTAIPLNSWTTCWPGAATPTGCAPGPTPATSPPHGCWRGLLVERGDLDEAAQFLRARADVGDLIGAWRLAGLLSERGDVDGLRARADAGDRYADKQLAELLIERGDVDGCAPGPTSATETPPGAS